MSNTLEDLSREMELSPSGLRKRIHALGLEVEKGSRGKWFISEELLQVLREADRLMKDGAGAATTRRVLGLESPSVVEREPVVSSPPVSSPHTPNSLEQALAMLAAERQRSEQLQTRVGELLGRVAELTGACAMFQERTKHMAIALQNLQHGPHLRLAAGKALPTPWWKAWKRG